MTDQTPDPWEGVPLAIRREVFECATSNGRISPEYLGGLYRRGAQARTVVDHDGEVLTQAAVDRLLLERAQHQQEIDNARAEYKSALQAQRAVATHLACWRCGTAACQPNERCDSHMSWTDRLQTEVEHHKAWRKRADEAEATVAQRDETIRQQAEQIAELEQRIETAAGWEARYQTEIHRQAYAIHEQAEQIARLSAQVERKDACQCGDDEVCAMRQEITALRAERDAAIAENIRLTNSEIEALSARCATLTEALTRLRDCDWTIGRGDRMDAVRDIARAALQSTRPQEQP